MNYLEKITLLYKNPKEFIIRFNKYFHWIVLDKLYFLFTVLLFTFFPNFIHVFFSGVLIKKKDRWKKGIPENEWIFNEKPKQIYDEINVLCRGSSLSKYLNKINRDLPTFFVNFDRKSLNKIPEIQKIPYIGITADINIENKLLKSGLSPIITLVGGYIDNNNVKWDNYNSVIDKKIQLSDEILKKIGLIKSRKITHFKEYGDDKRLYIGSAVTAIFFLGNHSKKINIYGWDHYLDDEVEKLGYFQALYNMAFKAPSGLWDKRFKFVFAEAIWNWFYASRLEGDKKYKVFSNLSNISRQRNILKKINRIFLNT